MRLVRDVETSACVFGAEQEEPRIDDQLQIACDRLDLLQVASALGVPLKNGVQLSPFRKERNPSFSVFNQGQFWKDHTTDESGGTWKFLELARPEWDKAERARWLIELSGQDPKAGSRMSKTERRERLREQTLAKYRRHRAEAQERPRMPECEPWPGLVRDRYGEGYLRLKRGVNERSTIAEERGWFDYTVEQVVELGLMAEPLLPWSSKARGVAFLVQRPMSGPDGPTLENVGYHQRSVRRRKNRYGETVQKTWTYVPCVPANPHTEFQIALAKLNRSTPALPFVLGNIRDPSLIVITEGQWDAIAFWAACCGEDGPAAPAHGRLAIFGLRGASSPNLFLSAWSHLLRTHTSPTVWLLGDNDEAGRRWTSPTVRAPGTLPSPSFSDRLRAQGAGRLVTTFLAGDGIKDFDDYYARHMPEPADMAGFFKKAGLEWVG